MNTPADDTKVWRDAILRRELARQASSLSLFAAKLQERADYANVTPRELAQLISGIADILHQHVPDTPFEMLSHLSAMLCELGERLQHVERARISHTPWSMIDAYESFLRKCTGDGNRFLISPQWKYNYGVEPESVGALYQILRSFDWIPIEEWNRVSAFSQQSRIYCISFPRAERNNALLHAVLAHELGHVLTLTEARKQFDSLWLQEEKNVRQALRQQAENTVGPAQGDLFRTALIEEHTATMTETARTVALIGFRELTADFMAVHLFGPAAFASLAEFAARKDLDAGPFMCQNYPPWRYRLRSAANAIREDVKSLGAGAPHNVAPLMPWIRWLIQTIEIADTGADKKIIDYKIETREAFRIIDGHLQDVCQKMIAQLPPELAEPYRLASHASEICELLGNLINDIPPNEIGCWPDTKPADIRDILNSGWAYKMKKTSEDPEWASFDNVEALFLLVLKGIEASHVHTTYGPRLSQEACQA